MNDLTAKPRSAQKGFTWSQSRVRKGPGARGNHIGISRRGTVNFGTSPLEDDKSVLGHLQSCRSTATQTDKENVKEEARLAWIRMAV
jgi:hypothetical protein